jgi:hypothetical protein
MKKSIFNLASICFFALLAMTANATTATPEIYLFQATVVQEDCSMEKPAGYIILPAGTRVTLILNQETGANDFSVGNAIEFKVKGDVRVNGKVAIPDGARATGVITKVKKSCEGKCSEITFTADEVQAIDGSSVALNSTPHIVKVPCCDGDAQANIGTLVRATTLDEEKIKD